MSAPALPACPNCRAVLGPRVFNQPALSACPSCNAQLQVEVFPALFRPEQVAAPVAAVAEGESGCFYHPEKQAATVCEACGRFLCALCDVDLNGQHLCPGCIDAGKQKGKLARLQNTRVRHDLIAMAIALVPLVLCFWPSLLGGPTAVGYALWHWKSPGSITPVRIRVRLFLALLIGALECIGWGIFFIMLWLEK